MSLDNLPIGGTRHVVSSGGPPRGSFLRGMCASAITGGLMFPRDPALADAGQGVNVSLTVDRSSQKGFLQGGSAGLSYDKVKIGTAFFEPTNRELVGCFQRLGPSLLRIGGNSADKTNWVPSGSGRIRRQVSPSDIDPLASFLKTTQWKLIYGINLATNTPASAAAEASYAARSFGNSLASFEIGNETDAYSRDGARPSTYSVNDFIAEWVSFATAIRQAVPGAALSGPASGYRLEDWTVPFAARNGSQINLLTQHLYEGSGKSSASTISMLLKPRAFLAKDLSILHTTSVDYGISGGYRLTEANSLYSGGADGVSNAHASALWAADFLLINAQFSSKGVNFHGGGDGTYNPFYTPIADIHNRVSSIRPVYYGMLFVTQIPPGPMYEVHANTTLNLTAYAITGSDGSTYIVIINKEPNTVAVTSIDLGTSAARANALTLTGPGLEALDGTTLGGSPVGTDGSWTPKPRPTVKLSGARSVTVNVPAASAMLVSVSS